jgi:hypothetical protein
MATDDDQGSGTARKSATKKETGTRKQPAKRSSAATPPRKRSSAPSAAGPRRASAADIAQSAAAQLAALSGQEVEGVTALERTDDGWKVQIEVVELRRIPSTTDVLASYEVVVDSDGDLEGYRRVRRYTRGQTRNDQ